MTRSITLALLLASTALAGHPGAFEMWMQATVGRGGAAAWTPADLGTALFRWYEADPTYMVGGANPTQLLDRSSYAVNLNVIVATNVSPYATDTNGVGQLGLGLGAAPYFGSGGTADEVGMSWTALVVVQPTQEVGTAAGTVSYPLFPTNAAAPGRAFFQFGDASGSWANVRVSWYSAVGSAIPGYAQTTANVPATVAGHVFVTTGTNEVDASYFYNGNQYGLTKSRATVGHFATNNYMAKWNGIGYSPSKRVYWTCLIVVKTNLTETDRQKLEGWAAHRFKFTNDLPAAHPYKGSPP